MLFELRHYYIVPGRREEFIEVMEQLAIPFQLSKGMVVLGGFRDLEDPDLYIWLRRYRDEQERQRLYDAVYGSEFWKNEVRPRIADLLLREKSRTHLMEPTAGSILQ